MLRVKFPGRGAKASARLTIRGQIPAGQAFLIAAAVFA
jgi:hypothetical protein